MQKLYEKAGHLVRELASRELHKALELLKADDYDAIALALRDLLLARWERQQRAALKETLRIINQGRGVLTRDEISLILAKLDKILGINMAASVDNAVGRAVRKSYKTSQYDILQLQPSFNLIDTRAIEWQHENHLYWIGRYYGHALNNEMKELGDEIINKGLARQEAAELFRAHFAGRFPRTYNYWENLSNHIVTRAREFGRVSAYEYAEYEFLEIVAVLDHRTSPVCAFMNGKKIPVSRAVKLRNDIIDAHDPKEVKEIDKWHTYDDIKDLKTEELPLSMALPPYHFGCRTRTVADMS